ncbi:hypothetical protein Back11_03440 [Paenibacillus baekrokdamisoli]|uniref:Uncharacterized protein n=1 Tax=Paenibacillus baekrokdamisoli TaxID=1712516 RepID=A0A3G9J7P1_9BACL|nr:S-layer homology domain-containing protein [Paenibacillus baekrokdamisoli]MBB3072717.1 hypothetical protein [Paenibacillus baekrokdamisoli]BBH18999.1 hypothetical protein Back11_03440 [Paenibacillus baekrokdamisoli]
MKMRKILFCALIVTLFAPFFCFSPASNRAYASPALSVDGNTSDWATLPPLVRNYTMSHTMHVFNNNSYLYLLIEGGGLSAMTSQLYIDSDNNELTGCNKTGWQNPSGADILLESEIKIVPTEVSIGGQTVVRNIKHERLVRYKYTGTSGDCKWSREKEYEGNGEFFKGEYVIEARIPLADLGLLPGDSIRLGFVNYHSDMDRLPLAGEPLATYTLLNGTDESNPPTSPLNLAVSRIESTKLELSWDAATDDTGVTGYKVYRKPVGGTEAFIGWAVTPRFLDRWLEPTTSYSYRVVAYDASGNSSLPSASLSGTTVAYPTVPASTGNWNDTTKLLFNYTIDEAIDSHVFADYDLLVLSGAVSPEKIKEIKTLNPNIFIVGYISVGQDSPIGNDIDIFFKDGKGNPECDANWPSCYIDPTHPKWQKKVLEQLLPSMVNRGFDGFYLDTVDVTESIHTDKAWGMGQLIQLIKKKFPDKIVFSGGGAHLLTGDTYDIANSIDAMLFESYTSTWVGKDMWNSDGSVFLGNDEQYNVYTPYDHPRKMDYITKRDHVNKVRFIHKPDGTLSRDLAGAPLINPQADFRVFTLDYATPDQTDLMTYAANRAWADGFYPSFGMKLLYLPPAYDWMDKAAFNPGSVGSSYSLQNFGKGIDLLKYASVTVDGNDTDWAGMNAETVYGSGSIASMSIRTDGTNLNILVKGTGLNNPGQRVILNTDRFDTSGYQFPEWSGSAHTGTDFMIENGTLFRHKGDPWSSSGWTNWSWEKIENVLEYKVSNDGTIAEMSVPLSALFSIGTQKTYAFTMIDAAYMKFSGASTTETLPAAPGLLHADLRLKLVSVDGSGTDWSALSPIVSPTAGGTITSMKATNDAYHLYMLVNGTNMNLSMGRMLLNTDNNEQTGYQSMPWSPLILTGADFMVENGQIYKYVGTGADWNWVPVVKYPDVPVPATGYAASSSALEMAIPLDAVNLTSISKFKAAFVQFSGNAITGHFPYIFDIDLAVAAAAATATTAIAANNSVSASPSSVMGGGAVTLTAIGDRQAAAGAVVGDEKYIPTSWTSTEAGKTGNFTLSGGNFTSMYTTTSAGGYTVTATFTKQTWNGSAWVNTATTDTKITTVTVITAPSAPTNITAVAGNGQATVSFTPPANNGGSAITGYEVTASPGNIKVTGTASPITITGLSNGTNYTFTVKAINVASSSSVSAASNAVTPSSPYLPSQPSTPTLPETQSTGADVLVNGKLEHAGTATTTKVNGQTVTTVLLDPKKLEDKLSAEGQFVVITIPVNTKSDVVIGELDGQMVKNMEQKQAVLKIKTENATYTLPSQQININSISNKLGKEVALQEIKIQIEVAKPTTDMVKIVENAAAKGGFTIVVPPLDFTVRATYGNTTIEVSKFNVYVERAIAIPDGVDPNKITTGAVVDPDGTVRHVPTKIIIIDGKYYAKVSSLTNSTYAIVWHPLEFKDVAQHWAKDAINDMGSRMVINGIDNESFNPEQDITRAEFTAIMVRGLGLKLESGDTSFADVKSSEWYSSAIKTAYSHNLISGFEDGTFHPMDKITREQAMTIIAKAMTITNLKAKQPSKDVGQLLSPFTDASHAAEWAKSGIADCLLAGIVLGRNSTELAPKAYISRAEVAAIVQRLLKKSDLI